MLTPTVLMNDTTQAGFGIVPIADLVPTQVTVGMREVDFKRRRWRKRGSQEAAHYLETRRFPVVLGPDSRHYLLDRHHLALALRSEGLRAVPVSIVANMRGFPFATFWTTLEARKWTHPFDDAGRRRPYEAMPRSVDDLVDDPFRSLAGALKRAGGYAKDRALFSEFRWANFLRCRISRDLVESDFERALRLAMNLAQSTEAAFLPGWRPVFGVGANGDDDGDRHDAAALADLHVGRVGRQTRPVAVDRPVEGRPRPLIDLHA